MLDGWFPPTRKYISAFWVSLNKALTGWKTNLADPNKGNGTVHFKNVNNCLNTKFHSYLETPDGQSSNLYFNVVHFFNTSVNKTSAAA